MKEYRKIYMSSKIKSELMDICNFLYDFFPLIISKNAQDTKNISEYHRSYERIKNEAEDNKIENQFFFRLKNEIECLSDEEAKEQCKMYREKIVEAILQKDPIYTKSNISKIISGLKLYGIECSKISVEEMKKSLIKLKQCMIRLLKIDSPNNTIVVTNGFIRKIYDTSVPPYLVNIAIDEELKNLEQLDAKFEYNYLRVLHPQNYRKLASILNTTVVIIKKMLKREKCKYNVEQLYDLVKKLENEVTRINNIIDKEENYDWKVDGIYEEISKNNLPHNIVANYLKEQGLPLELAKLIVSGYFDEFFSWDNEKAYQIADGEIFRPELCNIFGFGEYIETKLENLIDILIQANNQFHNTDYPFEYLQLFNLTINTINEGLYMSKTNQLKLEKSL